jgi:hypothetical protein
MIACTVSLLILTIVMFTLSNPWSTDGPSTERVLSHQATTIGRLMSVAWTTPLVLSLAYLMYGELCCNTVNDEEAPGYEPGSTEHLGGASIFASHIKDEERAFKTKEVDYVVLVISILHWGLIFIAIVLFLFNLARANATDTYGEDGK